MYNQILNDIKNAASSPQEAQDLITILSTVDGPDNNFGGLHEVQQRISNGESVKDIIDSFIRDNINYYYLIHGKQPGDELTDEEEEELKDIDPDLYTQYLRDLRQHNDKDHFIHYVDADPNRAALLLQELNPEEYTDADWELQQYMQDNYPEYL